jgi:ABC-2 type transport system permease protein
MWAIFSARFRGLLQYRAAALAGLATQFFWGLIRLMIFDAFYRSSTAPQPMDYAQVAVYIWLGQAFFALLPQWMDAEIQESLRSGTVAYEMLRPVGLYELWFARNLASRTAPVILRAVPLLAIAIPFLGLGLPVSWTAAGAFCVAMVAAALLSAAIATLMTTTLLWTVSGEGIWQLLALTMWLFSGTLIPLPFFPEWLQPLVNALPFRGLMDVPFRIWSGHIPPSAVIPNLASVVGWTVALIGLGRLLIARGTRKLVVQGG